MEELEQMQYLSAKNKITEVIETIDINKPDDVEVDEEEMQRYNFLFESSKEMYPDVALPPIFLFVKTTSFKTYTKEP